MGQKVHPLAMRLGIIKNWNSRWFIPSREYSRFILEDYKIRKFIKARLKMAAISNIIIERLAERIKVRIQSARPGIIIGRHGTEIERLREELNTLVNKEIAIDIEEVKQPSRNAQLIAQNVAFQLEKRVAFRRAIKRAIEQATASGALGVKISVAGRLGGAEMSRRETYREGKIPLATLRADIDYGFAEALTTYGLIGVKVWVYNGDILLERGKEGGASVKEDKGNAVNA
ncbi:30S ribosomal protein S3 [Candidatus Omnitrophota bacterium]